VYDLVNCRVNFAVDHETMKRLYDKHGARACGTVRGHEAEIFVEIAIKIVPIDDINLQNLLVVFNIQPYKRAGNPPPPAPFLNTPLACISAYRCHDRH